MDINLAYQARKARQKANLTQEQLAKMIGTTFVQVSRWENGKRPLSMKWLQKIAKATNHELVVAIIPNTNPQPVAELSPAPKNDNWYV